ncbi:MAG: relaxase/mobilization nuclease domain-containing protein, partial [Lachnospiraceae bacterium]|nr:relaxase/mobilization nuclease domain-containing protein [Lachnospiraceae bacterium]
YKENICQQFYSVIIYYSKTSSFNNVLHHLILSFDYNDECWINDTEAFNIVKNALYLSSLNNGKDCIAEYQFVYSLHRDSSNIHLHIVINSVCPFNGKMLNVNKTFIANFTFYLKMLINDSKLNKRNEYLKKPPIDKDYDYVYDIVMNKQNAVITVVYE